MRILLVGECAAEAEQRLTTAGHRVLRGGDVLLPEVVVVDADPDRVTELRRRAGQLAALFACSPVIDPRARARLLSAGADEILTAPLDEKRLVEAAAAACATFDPVELRALTDEDDELAHQLTRMFCGNAPAQVEQLRKAVAGKRFDEIGQVAHRFKGALLTVAARPAARLALALEQAAYARTTAGMEEAMSALGRMVARLMDALMPEARS